MSLEGWLGTSTNVAPSGTLAATHVPHAIASNTNVNISTKTYFCRQIPQQKLKADPGFVVKQWGSTGHDVKLTNMRSPDHDVVPMGFCFSDHCCLKDLTSERRVVLRLKKKRTRSYTKPTFSVEEQRDRPVTSQLTVQFKTRFLSAENRLTYAARPMHNRNKKTD